ncbi:MAG TPA: hypothetical protein VFZ32_18705 [Micromonosporaceae bacterium]
MEPISVALLAALAGGAGGELGRQLWAGLGDLVKRSLRRTAPETIEPTETALAALERAPNHAASAEALADALQRRSATDPRFTAELRDWLVRARSVVPDDGQVRNTISGGVQRGPVIQGRDFSGPITFGTPPPDPGPQ